MRTKKLQPHRLVDVIVMNATLVEDAASCSDALVRDGGPAAVLGGGSGVHFL
jgi:hypothetical protein